MTLLANRDRHGPERGVCLFRNRCLVAWRCLDERGHLKGVPITGRHIGWPKKLACSGSMSATSALMGLGGRYAKFENCRSARHPDHGNGLGDVPTARARSGLGTWSGTGMGAAPRVAPAAAPAASSQVLDQVRSVWSALSCLPRPPILLGSKAAEPMSRSRVVLRPPGWDGAPAFFLLGERNLIASLVLLFRLRDLSPCQNF
jgi:hypothetical protein